MRIHRNRTLKFRSRRNLPLKKQHATTLSYTHTHTHTHKTSRAYDTDGDWEDLETFSMDIKTEDSDEFMDKKNIDNLSTLH